MRYILSAATLVASVVLLTQPASVGSAVRNALNACLEVMIPSLFAFTVLSIYLQGSGLYRIVFRPLTVPLSKLLRLDEELCAVFLLANIGGYPVGARLLTDLVKNGRLSDGDAGRLLCCCYGSGPAFVIGIAGMGVFGSAAAGAVIFAACFLSSLIVGLFVCRFKNKIDLAPSESIYDLSAARFVNSVTSAARVMFTVCVMIVSFAAVSAVLETIGIQSAAETLMSLFGFKNSAVILPTFLEISRLRDIVPTSGYAYPLCGALLSFGGVCVILQISAITEGRIPLKSFIFSRIPAAALTALLSSVGILLGEPVLSVYAPSGDVTVQPFSVNATMSLCVIIMCGMLLACQTRKQRL
ncbi:MAG: hypothetical protein IJZ95_09730 [Oscillospiraceae bacterium]|nr:hypothetical protein [Oscillospiraceae bacterium]